MTAFVNQPGDASGGPETGNLLSSEPEKRAIELQLIERMLSPLQSISACRFGRFVATASEDSASANFARMTDPSTDVQLAKFEQEVTTSSDFGQFRGRRERN